LQSPVLLIDIGNPEFQDHTPVGSYFGRTWNVLSWAFTEKIASTPMSVGNSAQSSPDLFALSSKMRS
jgi:hypothetical protein